MAMNFGFQLPHPFDQGGDLTAQIVDRPHHRIRQGGRIAGQAIGAEGVALAAAHRHPRRNADHRHPGRDIGQHHRIGADPGAFADGDRPQHLSPGTDDHPVIQGGMTFAPVQRGAAEGDAVIEGDIGADFRGLADHHPGAVVDEQAGADGGAGMNLDSGEQAPQMGEEAAGHPSPALPAPMGQPVNCHRMQAGVAEQHLEPRMRGGITGADRINVFAKPLENHSSQYVNLGQDGRDRSSGEELSGAPAHRGGLYYVRQGRSSLAGWRAVFVFFILIRALGFRAPSGGGR